MWKLLIPIGVNLLLGIPAIIPIFLMYYFMVNGPLASLGWTQRDPNEDDGMLLWLVIDAPVFCLFGSIWVLVNLLMRPKIPVPAFPYWFACVAAPLVPFMAIPVVSYIAGFFLF